MTGKTKVTLVGTHHHDLHGRERLIRLLGRIKPDIVIAEGSEEKLRGHEEWMGMFREMLLSANMSKRERREWLKIENAACFELWASEEYCLDARIPFFYFDDGGRVRTREERITDLDRYRKIVHKANPMASRQHTEDRVGKIYRLLDMVIGHEEEVMFVGQMISQSPDYKTKSCGGDRDEVMDRRLREKALCNNGSHIACVNGYFHTLRDPDGLSLYSRIRLDFGPERTHLGRE